MGLKSEYENPSQILNQERVLSLDEAIAIVKEEDSHLHLVAKALKNKVTALISKVRDQKVTQGDPELQQSPSTVAGANKGQQIDKDNLYCSYLKKTVQDLLESAR